ncbi:uncharacterized protein LOC126284839 isoform X3 [Schistocerca gregaria]|uniref:uncharacterized protein LOC126284839 isoform X3 n=1 Tax=Schistocerca gregaria TaxID=7010 RepID=UPI00211EE1E7|nr:uncharacterized protein LOC126284839 isoform X3 [Schistocerca gregaria]
MLALRSEAVYSCNKLTATALPVSARQVALFICLRRGKFEWSDESDSPHRTDIRFTNLITLTSGVKIWLSHRSETLLRVPLFVAKETNMSAGEGIELRQHPEETEVPLHPHWRRIFNKYDLNNDGRISLIELKNIIRSASYERDIPDVAVREILRKADQDQNGYLEWDEFVQLVHMKEYRSLFAAVLGKYIRATVVPRHRLYEVDVVDGTGEYEEQYSCWPPAVAMIFISIIENWSEMKLAILQALIFFILAASDIGSAIYNRYVLKEATQIGYAAHIAGALAGLLVGVNVLRNLQVKPWEKVLRWTCFVLYFILMIGAIIWNAAFPDYFPVSYYRN